MPSILQILYTSHAFEVITEEFVRDLLTVSRRNNSVDQITGFLVARGRHFLQLLEGPEDKVRNCLERIQKDQRHYLLQIHGEAFSNERIMPDWNMGWLRPQHVGHSAEDILELFSLSGRGEKQTDPDALRAMVRLFATNAEIVD